MDIETKRMGDDGKPIKRKIKDDDEEITQEDKDYYDNEIGDHIFDKDE